MTPDVAGALIGEARQSGLRVSVHAPNLADAKEAITRGATALAHGVLDPIDEWTLGVMKSRPVFYIPTMDIFEFLADTKTFIESVLSDPRAERGLPPAVAARYRSPAYSEVYGRRYPNFRNLSERLPGALFSDVEPAGDPPGRGALPRIEAELAQDPGLERVGGEWFRVVESHRGCQGAGRNAGYARHS